MCKWPINLFNSLQRSYSIHISVIVLYLCIEKLLPLLLSLSMSSAVFNPINTRQANQSPTCCRDFEEVNGNKQQCCLANLAPFTNAALPLHPCLQTFNPLPLSLCTLTTAPCSWLFFYISCFLFTPSLPLDSSVEYWRSLSQEH